VRVVVGDSHALPDWSNADEPGLIVGFLASVPRHAPFFLDAAIILYEISMVYE
jgi:hypothetical protein